MELNNTFEKKSYPVRIIRLLFGLLLYGLGVVLVVHANIGLAPWDAFASGLSLQTGASLGSMVTAVGAGVLILVLILREKIGLGTILNTLLIGTFVDIIQALNVIPVCERFLPGLGMLLVGQFVIALASYFYISPGFGCGPRDSLMVALCKRMPKVPVGVVRGITEAAALLFGFLLGAKVGIGTIISVFGISFILQFTFRMLRFDVKTVEHESIFQTFAVFLRLLKRSEAKAPADEEASASPEQDEHNP